jgi:plastocyanin
MRRRLALCALAVALLAGAAVGVAAASAPAADGPPATASFTAVDFAWNVTGSSSTQANIAPGGTVTFSYPSGGYHHNADFGSGPLPTSCSQTAGPSSGSVPPLPNQPTAPGWSGTCTFDTAGTYTFHCDMHPFMTATVIVGDSTATTTTGTTPTTATTQTTTTTTTTSTQPTTTTGPPVSHPPASPLSGSARSAITIGTTQRGTAVRGSMRISPAGRGGRARVSVFAPGAALGVTDRRRVGTLERRGLPARRVTFSVPLNGIARRALHRAGRLTLSVMVTVTSPNGAGASVTRRVRMRG